MRQNCLSDWAIKGGLKIQENIIVGFEEHWYQGKTREKFFTI